MGSLHENTGADYAGARFVVPGENIVRFPAATPDAEDEAGTEVLQLVEEAATRLERPRIIATRLSRVRGRLRIVQWDC